MSEFKDSEMRNVVLQKDENGYWIVDVPSLPGCHTFGETREEAIAKVKEAIKVYIEALKQDELPIPDEDSE